MTFGEWLRSVREALNLTQVDLAARTGITNTYLSKIEHGHTQPAFAWADRAASALWVPVEEVYTRLLAESESVTIRVGGLDDQQRFALASLIARADVARPPAGEEGRGE